MKKLLISFLATLGIAFAQPTVPINNARFGGTNNVLSGASFNTLSGASSVIAAGGTFTNANITAGQVMYAGVGGLMSGAAAFTFNSGTGALSATNFLGTFRGNTFTTGTGTLTIAASKTLTANDNITLASDGTGTRTLNIAAGGTLGSNAFTSTGYLPLAGGTMVGNLLFTDNTYDIGASGATRPRTGYFGTSIISPAATISGLLTLSSTSGTSTGGVLLRDVPIYADSAGSMTVGVVSGGRIAVSRLSGTGPMGYAFQGAGSSLGSILYFTNSSGIFPANSLTFRNESGSFLWTGDGGTTAHMSLTSAGALTTVDTINSGSTITSGSNVRVTNSIQWISKSDMSSPTDGIILVSNNAGSGFTGLKLGPATSGFPYLKVSGPILGFRLADDSGDAAITAGAGTFSGLLSTDAITMGVADKFSVTSGTNQRAGDCTLDTGGTVTVNNTTVTANTKVLATRHTSGGTPGTAIVYTTSAATSFTITSDNALDRSVYTYFLIEVP